MNCNFKITIFKSIPLKKIILLVLFVYSLNIINAQDTSIIKPIKNIKEKINEADYSHLNYKNNIDEEDTLNSNFNADLLIPKNENVSKYNLALNDLFIQGQTDATKYYKDYKKAGTGVFITTSVPVFGILLGILPVVWCTNSGPLDKNLGYRDSNLMKNEAYANGYKQKAKEIKNKKIIRNYISGIGMQAGFIFIVIKFLFPLGDQAD